MDESNYKVKKIIYELLCIVLCIFSILVLILALVLNIKVLLFISLGFIAISVVYLAFLNKIINSLKNRFKELVMHSQFITSYIILDKRQL